MPKKVNLLFRVFKKLAHTHGFDHEPSGLKSKHLTTRPRTPELCDLRAERRELSPEKKHPHFPITHAYRKCKNSIRRINRLNNSLSSNNRHKLVYFSHVDEKSIKLAKLVQFGETGWDVSLIPH